MLGFFGFQLANAWQNFGSNWRTQLQYNLQNPLTRSLILIVGILLFLIQKTYSRFAIIGVVLILASILMWQLQKKYLFLNKFYSWFQAGFLVLVLGISILITSFDPMLYTGFLPSSIAKPSSSLEHYRLTQVNLDILKAQPSILLTGLGLGSSGPAANYEPESKLKKDFEYLSYKWLIKEDRIKIPENWYLQLLLNGGLLYAILYLLIVTIPIWQLWKIIKAKDSNIVFLMGFVGILIGNIFLHLWENQTIALYWTILWLTLAARQKVFQD
jgi:O-antigen ligase